MRMRALALATVVAGAASCERADRAAGASMEQGEAKGGGMVVRVTVVPTEITLAERTRVSVVVSHGGGLVWPEIGDSLGDWSVGERSERRSRRVEGGGWEDSQDFWLEAFLPGTAEVPSLEFKAEGEALRTPKVRVVVAGVLDDPTETEVGAARGFREAEARTRVWPVVVSAALGAGGAGLVAWAMRRRAGETGRAGPTAEEIERLLGEIIERGTGGDARGALERMRSWIGEDALDIAAVDALRFRPGSPGEGEVVAVAREIRARRRGA